MLRSFFLNGYFSFFVGIISFSLSESVIKLSTQKFHEGEILLFRSLFLLAFLFLLTAARDKLHQFKTKQFRLHLLRSFFSVMSLVFAIKALSGLQLYSFTSLSFSRQIFIAIFGVLILKESVNIRHLISLILCVAGVLIAFSPGIDVFGLSGLYAIIAAMGGALAVLVFKKMNPNETIVSVIFYYCIASIAFSFFLNSSEKINVRFEHLPLFVLMALLHLIGSLAYTHALRVKKLTSISVLNYLSIPVSATFGFIFWREIPSLNMILSGGLIVVSTIVLFIKKDMLIALRQKFEG